MTNEPSTPLLDLIHAACDGTLDEPAKRQLESILASDPEAQREYLRWMQIDSGLMLEASSLAKEMTWRPVLTEPEEELAEAGRAAAAWDAVNRPGSLAIIVASLTTAIILLVMALITPPARRLQVGEHRSPDRSAFAARLVAEHDCEWENDSLRDADRRLDMAVDLWAGEWLRLRRGVARVVFDSGAGIVIEGPAEFRIVNDNAGLIVSGKLAATVPTAASGFSIQTPLAEVVDLGTEFGIEVRPTSTDVLVFQGSVEIETTAREPKIQLRTGQALRLSRQDGQTVSNNISFTKTAIRRRLPSEPMPTEAVSISLSQHYNVDVVFNGGPGEQDSVDPEQDSIDGGSYAFATRGYIESVGMPRLFGLPDSGVASPRLRHPFDWQLGWSNDDDGDNAIRIPAGESLSIDLPEETFEKLHLMATSGSGASRVRVTVHYDEGEPSTKEFVIPDWGKASAEDSDAYIVFDQLARVSTKDQTVDQFQWKIYGVGIPTNPRPRRVEIETEGGVLTLFGVAGVLTQDLRPSETDSSDPS